MTKLLLRAIPPAQSFSQRHSPHLSPILATALLPKLQKRNCKFQLVTFSFFYETTVNTKYIVGYSLYCAEACHEFAGPSSASLRPRNTASFKKMSQLWGHTLNWLIFCAVEYVFQPARRSSNNTFVSGAGGLKFKSRTGLIGRSVANGLPPLRHFFEKSRVVRAQWRGDGLRKLVTPFDVIQWE